MTILELPLATPVPVGSAHAESLADKLDFALMTGEEPTLTALADGAPTSRRDRFLTLLRIYELHTAPLETVGQAACFQHHPAVAALKTRCEQLWLDELQSLALPPVIEGCDPVSAMRAIAARDRLPPAYRWLAKDAEWDDLVTFLALEGGPDAGFDDLVAAGQIGLAGRPKLELAMNYWDEMGNGDGAAMHTRLHEQMVAAIEIPRLARDGQPTSALTRTVMGGLLATNRWLQPELLGALGLIELQAGPRCRLVLQAFDRLGAPAAAYPFYEVHAEVDPRHGKDWLDNAIAPIVEQHPEWGERIVRGAYWRNAVTNRFLADALELLAG